MKYLLPIIVAFLSIFTFKNQPSTETYEINGIVKGIPDNAIIYLSEDNKTIDSTIVMNETFKLSGAVKGPTNVFLSVKNTRDYKSFWLENNKITFSAEKGKFREAIIKGSKTQLEDNELSKRLKVVQKELERVENSYVETMTKTETDSLRLLYESTENKETLVYQDFIKEFPNSLVSAHVMNVYTTTWGKTKVQELFNNFSSENKSSKYGKQIATYLNLNKDPKMGDKFVDFEMNDTNGNSKKLSEIKGKLILLEFWAAWCGPCREENPNLVKTYEKYNPKGFEILAVSQDVDKKSWMKAIEDDKLYWHHVSDLLGSKNKASLIYGINGIPDNFLINENGVIVGRNLRGDKLNETLEKMLN